MIKDNILEVRERVAGACAKAKRDPESITIVAVSKGRPVSTIQESIAAGITDIGENRVQEAFLKYHEITKQRNNEITIKWHLVGHLQTNKVKEAVKLFDLIHSVDSMRLAQEIDKQAVRINKVQDILIEVKTSGEATKFGVAPEDAFGLIKEISGLKNISLKGLMTIAPLADNPENARKYFRQLRELRDKLITHNSQLKTLSMGMTDDFTVAIEEGATMVRVGRAIYE